MIDFEGRQQPLASPRVFRRRLINAGVLGLILIVASLAVGMAGYAATEHPGFLDGFLNAV